MQYKTAINASEQVFDPGPGMARLSAPPPGRFASPAANQHMADFGRWRGAAAANDLGRKNTEMQNQYYMTARKAQDQSVTAGLQLLGQQQANLYQQAMTDATNRYGFLNDATGGVLRGLL